MHDNFFVSGGGSLPAVLLISRPREEFQQHIPLHALFERPTAEAPAELIREARRREGDAEAAAGLLAEPEQLDEEEIKKRLAALPSPAEL